MRKTFFFLFFFIQASSSVFSESLRLDESKIIYAISMPFPSNHLFEVSLSVDNSILNNNDFIDFSLPAWRSGRYILLNLSSGVQEFSAQDGSDSKLDWYKINKDTWRVKGSPGGTYKITYKVFANEFSIRTRGLNDECAFIDASAVLMLSEKLRHESVEVDVIPYDGWHVTTGLDNVPGKPNSFYAPDYDYLADCPLLIGNQKDYDFSLNGKKITVSFPDDINYKTDTVLKNIQDITQAVYNFWGVLPFDHYNFLFISGPFDYGATEHINSTVFSISSTTFTNKDRYNTFLSNIGHEFFHTWNVKQLRPKGLDPYDYTKENYTGELWIAEGITSYYEKIFLLRAGYLTPDKFIEQLSNVVEKDIERPGNYIQSLYESSFDAWIKYNANTPNKYISESDYYAKGSNLGMLLDLEIRNGSANKFSLDNVMTTMYKSFPLKGGGYTNADFIKVCEQFKGSSMKNFFDSFLFGVDSLEWKKILNYAGLDLIISADAPKTSLGVSTRESGDRLTISYIVPGSAAYESGLDIDDEIIALDGYRVRNSNLGTRISDMQAGDEVKITVMREDKLREFNVILKTSSPSNYKVERNKDRDNLQEEILKSWLGGENN